ncbi:unnamed protein product [Candidula unifasciata]|uniref:Ankyrin repeat domain-containing protein 45 n=1 Tax=Candidula unifasciata TaxID=100452 RepID=A0A8S3ZX42_9EUPU|nr:unnamed protein product [Candidula unifasciata]
MDNLQPKLSQTSKRSSVTVTVEDDNEHQETPVRRYDELKSYIYTNDPNNFKRYLATLRNEEIREAVNERDETGKSPLDIAASLGRVKLTKMLIACGAKIDSCNSKGYSCIHHAAAWGHLPVLIFLVDMGANIYKRTVHGETPADLAARYNMDNCVEFLELTAAVRRLQVVINQIQDKLRDDKGYPGRFTKEEKLMLTNACTEKSDWLANATVVSSQEVKDQIAQLELCVQAVLF